MLIHVWVGQQLCLCLLLLTNCQSASATELVASGTKNEITITDSDRSTINRSNDSIWFDTNNGTVRPTPSGRSIDVSDRHDSIATPQTAAPPGWWSTLWRNFRDLLAWLFNGWPILIAISFIAMALVVGYLIYRYAFLPDVSKRRTTNLSRREKEKAKIRDLPFEVEESMFGLLAEAERYRAAGDYSKAIVYLFSYALVEMDSARCIRIARGKTNRVYLKELRDRDKLHAFTGQVILAFEYAFFGKHILSQEVFESIWTQLPSFESCIKQTVSAKQLANAEVLPGSN